MAADTPSNKIKVAVRHPIQFRDYAECCGERRSYQERCKLRKEGFSLRLEGTRLARSTHDTKLQSSASYPRLRLHLHRQQAC